ncbi:MAG: hypothetical protein AAFP22_24430, partial [Planctomycetota bacterium]
MLGSLALCAALQAAPLLDDSAAPAADAWPSFVARASERHGAFGARCAAFLAEHRPPGDEALELALLEENLTVALAARGAFPWARDVSEELFLNDVLPYAVLDETRERWRAEMFARTVPLVLEAATLEEAAQRINERLFDVVDVHYNTGRKRPNASPSESIA